MTKAVDERQPTLLARAEKIAGEFDLSPDDVRSITRHFVRQMKDGLAHERVWQLPSYVRRVPTGKEKGKFLAVDLGGSNCRICLVDLHGDSTFTVSQSKDSVPPEVTVNPSYRPLFDFVAHRIADFLKGNENPQCVQGLKDAEQHQTYNLGFTFSFTCEQTSLAGGRLIHWDKGWDIPDAVGRDPCRMLQEAIDHLGLPVIVSVLANDSVGTLLTRSYTSGPTASTLAAVILGTGTNAAYIERLSNVRRLGAEPISDQIMIINTEWGCFDDKMDVLPRTPFDDELDEASTDPGSQMLEKRVSGLYLGELLRLTILHLMQTNALAITCNPTSRIFERHSIDSSFLSELAKAGSDRAQTTIQLIKATLSAEGVTETDARGIQLLASAIARRAARLAGASLAAIIIQSGRLKMSTKGTEHTYTTDDDEQRPQLTSRSSMRSIHRFIHDATLLWRRLLRLVGMGSLIGKPPIPPLSETKSSVVFQEDIIDIGADGSLIEFYPMFEVEMRRAMRDVPEIGPTGDQRIRIGMAKDGSGVGAALIAQAASEMQGAIAI
ncbi:putative glucokinase [Aspergillus heteromorphus CBS 117.55]|uniref:Phosphotransferase n=1 Tax=Aspergillus heteromorphus CBS 117.55 TaxID=1448321 RepID=A0A317WX66_9EURO|nr:putative glucokinase [Aspergillus heteromorphus CBS 117.55]PWY90979.1 putative glucokinase [Aspergillus heteromorphus CBS 117.55]